MMNIDDFIEYAKVIRKYRPLLKEYNCYIDTCDDCLSLCNSYGDDYVVMTERNKINFTPAELDEYIKKVLIRDKEKDEIIQKIKNLQEEQKNLEILLKTIDNVN